jgi:16S rRNA (uracil1498-N3)-methyltransferase
MRVSRLYVDLPLTPNGQVKLDDEGAHYVRTVLRLKKDDAIVLFNGMGGEYAGVLGEVSRKNVLVNVKSWADRSVESPLQISLGLGISRGDRMDLSVQKAVELGVNRINPLITERCVVQLKGEKVQQRLQHWRKIIQHAAEQCGRTVMPELTEIVAAKDWVSDQEGLKIFLDPYAGQTIAELKPNNMQVTLLTGPEGGFTEQERNIAKAAGFTPVRLGSRILRTETAAIAVLSAVQMLWGDFAVAQYESANWEAER